MRPDDGATPALLATPRSTPRRRAALVVRDRAAVGAIIDQSLVCHVGFVDAGAPAVVPACPWRIGDWLYLHGAAGSRLLARVSGGETVCISLALVEGLVLARSALRHSLHYRSVVLFGRGEAVGDPSAKAAALLALIDKLSPGRSGRVRPPSAGELAATAVARLRIDEGGAKIAAAPPGATPADAAWPVWAGSVPLRLRAAAPVPADGSAALAGPALPGWLTARGAP